MNGRLAKRARKAAFRTKWNRRRTDNPRRYVQDKNSTRPEHQFMDVPDDVEDAQEYLRTHKPTITWGTVYALDPRRTYKDAKIAIRGYTRKGLTQKEALRILWVQLRDKVKGEEHAGV